MHNEHTTSSANLDVDHAASRSKSLTPQQYYARLAKDWVDPLPPPTIERVRSGKITIDVVREDLVDGKKRAADLLIRHALRDIVVYVAPRFGHAGIALAKLCASYGKDLVLFMPACREISLHQAEAIRLGANPIFVRIAAMPNLNKIARAYANAHGADFIPLGLRHELVTAALVATARKLPTPKVFHTAISTGVLSRSLQIAWPKASAVATAVARNIQDGERGHATLFSHPRSFTQNSPVLPHFPCASNYDAKAWDMLLQHEDRNCLFWNVAGDVVRTIDHGIIQANHKADVDWGFARGYIRQGQVSDVFHCSIEDLTA